MTDGNEGEVGHAPYRDESAGPSEGAAGETRGELGGALARLVEEYGAAAVIGALRDAFGCVGWLDATVAKPKLESWRNVWPGLSTAARFAGRLETETRGERRRLARALREGGVR